MKRRTLPTLVVALAAGALISLTLAAGAPLARSTSASPSVVDPSGQAIPVLAYYYIWFNPSSWNRAKIDYPTLGRYSSSDVAVMRQQVELAKSAGITGFLVGWKDTPVLNSRLAALVKLAQAADFKLGLVLQGLDFRRNPLPMAEVQRSMSYFAAHYAQNTAFDLFGKPVVVWSGTWMYTRAQMASITQTYGSRLTILATEKQPASYQALADLFKGDAYYWSSVDPLATPGYQQKLNAFALAVHQHGGLWLAPAAPGYDAQLIGGTRVVPRRGGRTLRLEMGAALRSSPDAIAIISWNEFSENTYVEPSRNYGAAALKVIAGIDQSSPAAIPDFDSSGPAGYHAGMSQFAILGVLVAILAGSTGVVVLRTTRTRR